MLFWSYIEIGLGTLLLGLLSLEVGYRFARWRRKRGDAEVSAGSTVLGAHVGLLAFLLAFTFGAAAGRFDLRKTILIEDSNAIGTCALRSKLLHPARSARVRKILIEYAEIRGVLIPQEKMAIDEGIARTDELLEQLWTEVEGAVVDNYPSDEVLSLFVASANEVIDMNAKRATVVYVYRIPPLLWAALLIISALCLFSLGFAGGLEGKRPAGLGPLLLSLSLVMLIISALDSPYGVRITQRPMLETLESMR